MTSEQRLIVCVKARWLTGKAQIRREEFTTWVICDLLPKEVKGEEVFTDY